MVFGVFYFSEKLGEWHRSKRALVYVSAAVITAIIEFLFVAFPAERFERTGRLLAALPPLAYGIGIIIFAKVFAADIASDRAAVDEFFKKLDTPVNVATEVFSAGQKEYSTAPLIGTILMTISLLVFLMLAVPSTHNEWQLFATLGAITFTVGATFYLLGRKRVERRTSEKIIRKDTNRHYRAINISAL
jgi:hypothetical protein